MSGASRTDGTLDGIVIIDLSVDLAGQVATQLLAEQGADVIKVESSGGDPLRSGAAFATWNRSKRSVVLDLGGEAGRAALDRLLADADVLVHSLSASAAAALGLDDATLAACYPALVCSAVPSYPVGHPDAERPGSELFIQARSGAMSEVASFRPGPLFMRLPIASWATAFLAASAIVTRLLVRQQTGAGGVAHTSLYDGMLAALTTVWSQAATPTENLRTKWGNPRDKPLTGECMFQCADGEWIHTTIGCAENPFMIESLAEAGRSPIVVAFGQEPTEAEILDLRQAFLRHSSGTWLHHLHAGDVPVAMVEPLGSVFEDPQAQANDYLIEVCDPRWGRTRQSHAPFLTTPPAQVRAPAPTLGQHTDEVLAFGARSKRSDLGTVAFGARRAPASRGGLAPLAGVRVLDFGAYIAGPFTTLLLADLGANVIKVEPLRGDASRRAEIMFAGSQRGKRSVAVDLAHPSGQLIVQRLLSWADVVHHNMRDAPARKLGLDFAAVERHHPGIAYSRVNAYGHAGPKAGFPGYDPIAFAASGWGRESVPAGEKPMWYRLAPMDLLTAMASTVATLLCLYRVRQTGDSAQAVTSMLGVAALLNSETLLQLDSGTLAPWPKVNADQTGLGQDYRIYELRDGWVAVDARGDGHLQRLCAVAGVESSPDIDAALRTRGSDEVMARLAARGVPVEAVRTDAEADFLAREHQFGKVARTVHPRYRELRQPGGYWNFGPMPVGTDRHPPLLGEHTCEVLSEVGFSPREIEQFLAAAVVLDGRASEPPSGSV